MYYALVKMQFRMHHIGLHYWEENVFYLKCNVSMADFVCLGSQQDYKKRINYIVK
jgi:hypothetical protein